MDHAHLNIDASQFDRSRLEISLGSALELCRLGVATLVDIRQGFELKLKGVIPGAVHIPLFEVKRLLGHALTEDEQDILDAGQPSDLDTRGFFTMVNNMHHVQDHLVLCICNSGRRSLYAADLLRALGYPRALSVGGGFQAWKKLPPDQQAVEQAALQGGLRAVPATAAAAEG